MTDSSIVTIAAEQAIPEGLDGRWWVAHTRPRNEKLLATELASLGIFHYLPLFERQTRGRARRRMYHSVIPVFPGYLFFNGTEEQRLRALTTNRIVSVLTVARQEELVLELRQVQQAISAGVGLRWHPELKVGDHARVIAGPLMGVEGVVTRRMSKVRLVLNVMMLGQSVSVEVSEDVLERASEPLGRPEKVR